MQKQSPLTLVVFGVTGELYQNKLAAVLFDLFSEGLLPRSFSIIGFARRPLSDFDLCKLTKDAIFKKNKNRNKRKLTSFLTHLKYMRGDLNNLTDFENLGKQLSGIDEKKGICSNKLFYLAVPPSLYASIFNNLSKSGLTLPCAPGSKNAGKEWARVLVEKPFGKDMREAKNLDEMLGELFDETQIFRIDHYLAKETMQNLLAFRFENEVFESLWNNKNIKRVQIVFHEKDIPEDTLEHRGSFYDAVGALRDVGQNHMLQMLALVAMEKPKSINARGIQNARGKVFAKTRLFTKKQNILMRGQYRGYLKESGIKSNSKTETFFRIVLGVNNKRWQGVPFEMESGKALNREEMSIKIFFKKSVCRCRHRHTDGHQNTLKFIIQPNEGIKFKFWFKRPGFDFSLMPQNLTFSYSDHYFKNYSKEKLRDAHEKVFYDCILGDQTLFVSTEEVMEEWHLVTDIIKKWQTIPLVIYKKGSKGKDVK